MIRNLCAAADAAFVLLIPEAGFGDAAYVQTNLTSDLPGAANLDTNLVNPWGIAFGPATPIWISDNHTGLATVYNGAGQTRRGQRQAPGRIQSAIANKPLLKNSV